MANNSAASYKFVLSTAHRRQLTSWAKRAAKAGKTEEYLAALNTIHHQLTTAPLVWGDPWFRLSQLGLQVYHRVCPPLHVSYAINPVQRIVYAVKFTLFAGSALEEGE